MTGINVDVNVGLTRGIRSRLFQLGLVTIRGGHSRRDGPEIDLFMIGVRHFLKSSVITVAITVTIRQ